MSFWTAIVSITALGILCAIISQIIQSKQNQADSKADDRTKANEERIAKIEKRLANLETIVLRQDKERDFDAL